MVRAHHPCRLVCSDWRRFCSPVPFYHKSYLALHRLLRLRQARVDTAPSSPPHRAQRFRVPAAVYLPVYTLRRISRLTIVIASFEKCVYMYPRYCVHRILETRLFASEQVCAPPASLRKWQGLKFGLFLHWGAYSQIGFDASWSLNWKTGTHLWSRRAPRSRHDYNAGLRCFNAG